MIAPVPGGNLTWAKVGYRCIHGPIQSDWKLEGGQFLLDVTIPTNTTATVAIPTADAASVTESGHPLTQAEGVKIQPGAADRVTVAIGSGTYHFAAKAR